MNDDIIIKVQADPAGLEQIKRLTAELEAVVLKGTTQASGGGASKAVSDYKQLQAQVEAASRGVRQLQELMVKGGQVSAAQFTEVTNRINATKAALVATERQAAATGVALAKTTSGGWNTGRYALGIGAQEAAYKAEAELQGRLSALRQGAYQAQIAADERVYAARASLREGAYRAQIVAEEKLAATEAYFAAGREKLRAGNYAAQIRAEEAAMNRFTASTVKASAAQQELRGALRGTSGALGGLWMTYTSLVPTIAAFATVSASVKGLKMAAELEQMTQYTQAIAEATGDYSASLTGLREKLLSIRDVADSPVALAEATKDLVKAGFAETVAVGEMAAMSKAATVAQENLGVVTKGVAAQFRAWNEQAVGTARGVSSLTQVANMMGYTAAASATDFGELNAMLAHATELAPTTSASFGEILAGLAQMANMGIHGTKAATALRTALLRLQNPTDEIAQKMAALRVPFSAVDEEGKLKSMTRLFEDLGKSLAPLTIKARTDLIADIFQLRGLKGGASMIRAISNAVDEGKFSFRGLSEQIQQAGEKMVFIDETFTKVTDNTAGKLDILKASIAGDFTRAFEDSNGRVRELVDTIQQAVDDGSFRKLVDGMAAIGGFFVIAATEAIKFKDVLASLGGAWAIGKTVELLLSVKKGIAAATVAQAAFNRVALLNPWVLGGAAMIYGVNKGIDALNRLKEAQIAANSAANGRVQSTLGGTGVLATGAASAVDQMFSAHSFGYDTSGNSAEFNRALAAEQMFSMHGGAGSAAAKTFVPDPNTLGAGTDTLPGEDGKAVMTALRSLVDEAESAARIATALASAKEQILNARKVVKGESWFSAENQKLEETRASDLIRIYQGYAAKINALAATTEDERLAKKRALGDIERKENEVRQARALATTVDFYKDLAKAVSEGERNIDKLKKELRGAQRDRAKLGTWSIFGQKDDPIGEANASILELQKRYEQEFSDIQARKSAANAGFDSSVSAAGREGDLDMVTRLLQDQADVRAKFAEEEVLLRQTVEEKKTYEMEKGVQKRKQLLISESRTLVSSTSSMLGSIADLIGESDEKSFNRSKKFRLAQAYMDMAAGAAGTFADTNGEWWIRAAAAAAAAAAQLVRVRQIQNQEFKGQAHDGLPFVRETGTYLLKRGEGVVKEEDNKKLQKFLDRSPAGNSQPQQVNVTISAVDAQSVYQLLSRNKGLINGLVQQGYDQRLATGGPLR